MYASKDVFFEEKYKRAFFNLRIVLVGYISRHPGIDWAISKMRFITSSIIV